MKDKLSKDVRHISVHWENEKKCDLLRRGYLLGYVAVIWNYCCDLYNIHGKVSLYFTQLPNLANGAFGIEVCGSWWWSWEGKGRGGPSFWRTVEIDWNLVLWISMGVSPRDKSYFIISEVFWLRYTRQTGRYVVRPNSTVSGGVQNSHTINV